VIPEFDPINEGDVIDLNSLGTTRLSIEAVTEGNVDSLKIKLRGHRTRVENHKPYTVFGDWKNRFIPWTPKDGDYKVQAIPYSRNLAKGKSGKKQSVRFQIINGNYKISDLVIINTDTGEAVQSLNDQDKVNLNELPPNISIEARVNGRPHKVEFKLRGAIKHNQVDKHFPYTLDTEFKEGSYKLVVKTFARKIFSKTKWWKKIKRMDKRIIHFEMTKENTQPQMPPVAVLEADPTEGFAPLQVRLDASQSFDSDGLISKYIWNFGDGSPEKDGAPIESHIFQNPGTYQVSLKVIDDTGLESNQTTTIQVNEAYIPLVPNFSYTITDTTVSFDSSSSTGVIDSYLWDFGDGNTSTEISPVHTYSREAAYKVTLIVRNANEQKHLTRVVFVGENLPYTSPELTSDGKLIIVATIVVNMNLVFGLLILGKKII
jgi:PKD repeat protein